MTEELKPCPFCGDQPTFGPVYDPDDRRYMAMDISCCAKMSNNVSYPHYDKMSPSELVARLQEKLTVDWNARAPLAAPSVANGAPAGELPPLPQMNCTYADHSYPAYNKHAMAEYGKTCYAAAIATLPKPVVAMTDTTPLPDEFWELLADCGGMKDLGKNARLLQNWVKRYALAAHAGQGAKT